MSWVHALLLGLIQGLTEFLPVSSSGHLALAQMLIPGFEQPGVVGDAMLHLGTAAAVVVHERHQLRRWLTTAAGWHMALLIVVGTAATGVVALPLRGIVHAAFEQAAWVGAFLVLTGLVVLLSRWLAGGDRTETGTDWRRAALLGLVQGLAVFPGLSRSGTTITAGLAAGLDRGWAARFSFLLGVPAILGASLVEVLGERAALARSGIDFWLVWTVGAVVAGVTGFVALRIVIRTLSSRVFHRFGWYCVPLGLVVIVIAWRWPA